MARRGFADTAQAVTVVEGLDIVDVQCRAKLIRACAGAADNDLALATMAELDKATLAQLGADEQWLHRVAAVMGASRALGRHLLGRPQSVAALRGDDAISPRDPAALSAELWAAVGQASGAGRSDALRLANRDALLRVAARDLTADDPAEALPGIMAELSDLADAVVQVALALAAEEVPGHERVRLAVVALGKCGARELNYLSDVDVLFVAEPAGPDTSTAEALHLGSEIAGALMRLLSAHTAAGTIWQLDAALRPEGSAGPLVRTLDAMSAYYKNLAATWEFQAMMKARPMAGDIDLGRAFCDLIAPLVWSAGGMEGFVSASRAMRRRVVSLIPPDQADRELKLGAGGLRDVEFTAQILQLVHGRADEKLRQPDTLGALAVLGRHGYIARDDVTALDGAYRFERLLEHRQQLYRLRRMHLMAGDAAGLRRLARSMPGGGTGEALWARWRQTAALVLRLQQRVFYSPILEAVAKVPSGALRLSSAAAEERLTALGFADPAAGLRHIAALTSGVGRAAEITRHIMPAMLGWLADGANPDAGLLALRQVSEALGHSPWYLKALRDESGTAERLAHVMASSRMAVDLLRRDPPSVALLREEPGVLEPRSGAELRAVFTSTVGRHHDTADAVKALRATRRHELGRLVVAVVLGRLDVEQVGVALSDVSAATIDAGLALASRVYPEMPPLGVVAMGRWGGRELSFASDLDVLFVAPDSATDTELSAAADGVAAMRGWLAQAGPDPALDIDVRLRPEGQDGALVRTVASDLAYYGRWSWTWEAQALVRASHGAGNPALTGELLSGIAPLRWPADGLSSEDVRAIQALKVRLEHERGGVGRAANLKLGPGGLVDIEWTIQLLQLRSAGKVAALQVTGTLAALRAAKAAGIISSAEATTLANAWKLISRTRDALMLARGRSTDTMPSDPRDLAAVAMLLGYGKVDAPQLRDDLAKSMRQASKVVDRLFWGRA